VSSRAVVQARVLRSLVVGQMVAAMALASAVTVGAFVIEDILGEDTPWAGVATATVTIGTAVLSQMLSRVMVGRTRRAGLQLGYAVAACGGLLAAMGAQLGRLSIFVAGLFLYGAGQASNLLARYAATDLAAPDQRAASMGRILFAATFGAVFGPVLVVPAQTAGERLFGWDTYTGPWVAAALFLALAAINVTVTLRPDPLEVLRGEETPGPDDEESARPATFASVVRAVSQSFDARLAISAMVISHAAMVAVMTMTPVHLRAHGHESVSPFVISLHIAGMYAFSPWVGRFSDRHGRHATIRAGALLLVGSTVLAGVAGESHALLWPALWMLGIGWSFGLIGGSSLLVDAMPLHLRVRSQGVSDLAMSLCGGAAGFSSGFVRDAVGYHALSGIAGAFCVLLVALPGRRSAPPAALEGS
jgi:MFS family permease